MQELYMKSAAKCQLICNLLQSETYCNMSSRPTPCMQPVCAVCSQTQVDMQPPAKWSYRKLAAIVEALYLEARATPVNGAVLVELVGCRQGRYRPEGVGALVQHSVTTSTLQTATQLFAVVVCCIRACCICVGWALHQHRSKVHSADKEHCGDAYYWPR